MAVMSVYTDAKPVVRAVMWYHELSFTCRPSVMPFSGCPQLMTGNNVASVVQLVNSIVCSGMLQSQFNFVNIMIQPLDQGTNCVTVQTKPGQFICAWSMCVYWIVNPLLLITHAL